MATTPKEDTTVGQWIIVRFCADGEEVRETEYGKLVLQERWSLVLDPRTRAVKLAVPNENVGVVAPG